VFEAHAAISNFRGTVRPPSGIYRIAAIRYCGSFLNQAPTMPGRFAAEQTDYYDRLAYHSSVAAAALSAAQAQESVR
jgi:hypothetical protein